MLSEGQKKIQNLIETKLSGNDKDEALLFHVSVERKLASVEIWFENVESMLPDFVVQPGTLSGDTGVEAQNLTDDDVHSYLTRMSAYIDAFFMSGKSTLDTLAHEIRSLYDLGGHTGDLYFEAALDLIGAHHSNCSLNSYLTSLNIRSCQWYMDLSSYRRACAHESIIQIQPSVEVNYLTGESKEVLLKLPTDPAQRPLAYDRKNFVSTGREIRDNLRKLITESYDKVLDDIKRGTTKIVYDNELVS